MVRRSISSTILILGLALAGWQPAGANTPLTKAVVSSLRNQVRLLPRSRPARKAKLSDVLIPGDGIVTSRRSLAELRFNDGSLARMGEQAVFRFIPKTRSFRLSNGTVLMLIPPGQGRTQVRTPNVTAGIRGSALIIRYDQVTDTSTVIALTNSQISATNRDNTQAQVLAAGQAVVVVGEEIVDSYDVDLQELYRTSPLLEDLEMDNPDAKAKDEAIAQVREETLEGIQSQRSFTEGEGRNGTEDLRLSELNVDSVVANETGRPFGTALPASYTDVDSNSFPGQAIGVDRRFNQNGESTTVDPAIAPPSGVDLPVVPTGGGTPEFVEQPAVFEQPPVVQPAFTEQPVAADQPEFDAPVESPVIDDSISDGVIDNVTDSVTDTPVIDDSVAEVPMDDVGDSLADAPLTDSDVSDVVEAPLDNVGDSLVDSPSIDDSIADVPIDDAGGLMGGDDMGGDNLGSDVGDNIAGGDIGGDAGDIGGGIAGDVGDISNDISDVTGDVGNDIGGDDIGGGDIGGGDIGNDIGGDDIAGDLQTPEPINDADVLSDSIPLLDDTTDTLMPDDDSLDDPVAGSPGGVDIDIDADVTITVIINGEPTVIQGGTTLDAIDASAGGTSPISTESGDIHPGDDGLGDLEN